MSSVPDRNTFETAYAGQAPWDIGRPQQAFLGVADRITGSVLDAGCSTGASASQPAIGLGGLAGFFLARSSSSFWKSWRARRVSRSVSLAICAALV